MKIIVQMSGWVKYSLGSITSMDAEGRFEILQNPESYTFWLCDLGKLSHLCDSVSSSALEAQETECEKVFVNKSMTWMFM